MKKIEHYKSCCKRSSHVNLKDYTHMANLYFNYSVADQVPSLNGAVMISEDMLRDIVRKAYMEGWKSSEELNRQMEVDDNNIEFNSGKYFVHHIDMEQELAKKHKYEDFSDIVFNTPFHTKEHMMDLYNLTEEECEKNIKEYKINTYKYREGKNEEWKRKILGRKKVSEENEKKVEKMK